MNFEISLIFRIKPFFLCEQKVMTKTSFLNLGIGTSSLELELELIIQASLFPVP